MTKPGFSFCVLILCCSIFCYGCMFALLTFCVCFIFEYLSWPRDWLGRTSPKWPILCRVGCKTTTQSINMMQQNCWLGLTKGISPGKYILLQPNPWRYSCVLMVYMDPDEAGNWMRIEQNFSYTLWISLHLISASCFFRSTSQLWKST